MIRNRVAALVHADGPDGAHGGANEAALKMLGEIGGVGRITDYTGARRTRTILSAQ
jgi:citrate synthase